MKAKKIFCICILFTSVTFVRAQKLTIAVSSNAQYVVKELTDEFKKKNSVDFNMVVGSSGKLTHQILQGAPYNIFFSADMEYPQKIFQNKLSTAPPMVYAYGSLVLWTIKNIDISKGISSLRSTTIEKIALANPNLAPYGAQALLALKKCGIYPLIKKKIIQAESISQVNQYITTGNCDVGITAKSVVVSNRLKKIGKWIEVDADLYQAIPQGAVVIRKEPVLDNLSTEFLGFVTSPQGREILKRNGYQLNE